MTKNNSVPAYSVADYRKTLEESKTVLTPSAVMILGSAIDDLVEAENKIVTLKDEVDTLERDISGLRDTVVEYEDSAPGAKEIRALEIYADHSNWDGNVFKPLDLTIDRTFGDTLAARALGEM